MKKIIFLMLFFLGFFFQITSAQIKATTENGDEVILNSNGTWNYANAENVEYEAIKDNPAKFSKPKNASFLLKSSKIKMGVYLDSKKWSYKMAENNASAEYEFQLKGEDLYGMLICEKIEIPLDVLRGVALANARKVSSDIKITKQEYRKVNNMKMLMLQMNGTLQGIEFCYNSYYYSNKNGTVQFITYTSQNLAGTYTTEIEELLNGLVETK
jgi:hypothetical protein